MLLCMRTTIEVNDRLLEAAKTRAAKERTSLKSVVERALRGYLAPPRARGSYRLRWRAERGRLRPGIDLADRESLMNAMEERN